VIDITHFPAKVHSFLLKVKNPQKPCKKV
jgi:hypothetical protein